MKIFDDSRKDESGQNKLIGILNINNMIPVDESVIRHVDLSIHEMDKPEIKVHKQLMQKQLKWCREHADIIENRANKVYDMVVKHPDKNKNLVKRSSKFTKLETISDKYVAKKNTLTDC